MLSKLQICWILILVTAPLHAGILEELERKHPYYFSDLFDRSLYDLSHVNACDDASEHPGQLNEKLEQQLVRLEARKLRAVKNNIIKDIEEYVAQISKFDMKKVAPVAIKSTLTGMGAGGVLKAAVTTSTAATGGAVVGLGYAAIDVAVEYLKEDAEVKKAGILTKRILKTLREEELKELERKYITARFERDLPKDYQQAIENALLKARRDNGFNNKFDVKTFVNNILALPTDVILPRGCPKGLDASAFNKFRTGFLDKIFSEDEGEQKSVIRLNSPKYSEDVKRQLKDLMGNLCKFSYEAQRSNAKPTRKAAIFLGEPGCGKTTAAQLICREMGFPSYEFTIVKAEDFSQSTLCGKAATSYDTGKPSKYSLVLLAENSEGKRGKNVIILMDDIDRCYKLEGLVAFLMHLYDPQTNESYDDNFYGISKVDLNHIFVIATVNTDLRKQAKFAALLDRCYFIEFSGPTKEKLKETLRNYLTDDKFMLSSVFGDDPQVWVKVRADIASYIIDHHDIKDDRKRENRADQLLECPCDEWDNCAKHW